MDGFWLALALVATLASTACSGCHKSSDSDESEASAAKSRASHGAGVGAAAVTLSHDEGERWYRVTFERTECDTAAELCEIPILLVLDRSGTDDRASVVVGERRVSAAVRHRGAQVEFSFPDFHTRMMFEVGPNGSLSGKWVSESPAFGDAVVPIRAEPLRGAEPRRPFAPLWTSSAFSPDIAGTWKLAFRESLIGALTLRPIEGGAMSGVVHLESGSVDYLVGDLQGNKLRLSGFDGSAPISLTADIAADGKSLSGVWLAGQALDWRDGFTATRADDFKLPDLDHGVGKPLRIPEFGDPKYDGRPVIVEIGASWCSSCGDLAPVLQSLYDAHRGDGLEMLSLNYEGTDDLEYNDRAAAAFQTKFSIPWPVVAIDGTLDDYWSILPTKDLGIDVVSFPMLVFVDAEHKVHAVRVGFPGPEAGPLHEAAKADYAQLAKEIAATAK